MSAWQPRGFSTEEQLSVFLRGPEGGQGPWVRSPSPAQSRRDFLKGSGVKVSEPAPREAGRSASWDHLRPVPLQLLPVPALGETILCGLGGQAELHSSILGRQLTLT